MAENEVKDTTNPEENVVNEENDGLVEVVDEEVEDSEEVEKELTNYDAYPNSTSKLTGFIYLIIFISILIWVYFYVKQNPDLMNKITWWTETMTWEVESLTWENNIVDTNSWIESDNVDINNTESGVLISDDTGSEKDPAISTTTNTTWTSSKSEEVIIKDFEKELDSLFNVIDENAK